MILAGKCCTEASGVVCVWENMCMCIYLLDIWHQEVYRSWYTWWYGTSETDVNALSAK